MPGVAEQNDRTQRRQARCFELARRRVAKLGRKLTQDGNIVGGLEALGEDERLATDFVERVFKLGSAIGRIDIDQDEARFGGGELREYPFVVVWRPDADAVAWLEIERQEPGGELVDLLAQFAVA